MIYIDNFTWSASAPDICSNDYARFVCIPDLCIYQICALCLFDNLIISSSLSSSSLRFLCSGNNDDGSWPMCSAFAMLSSSDYMCKLKNTFAFTFASILIIDLSFSSLQLWQASMTCIFSVDYTDLILDQLFS